MNAVTWERALQEELRNIRRTSLPNGLTIVSEQMPHLRSISIGIWIRTGSRDEAPEINGRFWMSICRRPWTSLAT